MVFRRACCPAGGPGGRKSADVERTKKPPRLRLVVVLDEVDKLTVDDRGMAAVEELLSGTKNVLTMSGAHFLVIAGPDLQDRALRDAARSTGIYESVFGWRLYVLLGRSGAAGAGYHPLR